MEENHLRMIYDEKWQVTELIWQKCAIKNKILICEIFKIRAIIDRYTKRVFLLLNRFIASFTYVQKRRLRIENV